MNISERRFEDRRIENGETTREEVQIASSSITPGIYLETGFTLRIVNGAQVSLTARVQNVNYNVVGPYAVDHDDELSGMLLLGYAHPLR